MFKKDISIQHTNADSLQKVGWGWGELNRFRC